MALHTENDGREDVRLRSDAVRPEREERHDAATERTISDEDRLTMMRNSFMQARLPDLPNIPGWHLCWLSTTNQGDSIQWRVRLGYVPVTLADIPGWDHAVLKSGEWAGHIGINEMLAYKLPMDLYQMYMREAHHDAPNREDEKLRAALESMHEDAERLGGRLIEGDGTRELRERRGPPAPAFQG